MELDETEVKILEEIREDARISLNKLAEKVGVTTPTVSRKINKLESMDIIWGYSADLNKRRLGFQRYIFTVKMPVDSMEYISEELKEIPEVEELYLTDSSELIAHVLVSDFDVLDTFIDRLKVIENINGYSYSRVSEHVKCESSFPLEKNIDIELGCYYCHKPIEGEPVKLKMDGKDHYLCCEVCAEEYKKKYQELKERSSIGNS